MNFKLPKREQNSNKGTFGKVLNVAGSKNYIGAAYLSTYGIMKAGAGYTALAGNKKIIDTVSKHLPEAVFLTHNEGLQNIKKYNILLIGCGLGQQLLSKYYFKNFLNKAVKYQLTTIIDADGLNILAGANIKLPQNVIITPHPAEAARLLHTNIDSVLNDLEKSAKELTQTYNCITVLKTHRTIVCSQNNEIYINEHGNSALSKAGTGDVLAGIIAGLTAQNQNLFEMAKLGVYLHSRAGEIASEELTEYSVLASDIPKYLPKAIAELI